MSVVLSACWSCLTLTHLHEFPHLSFISHPPIVASQVFEFLLRLCSRRELTVCYLVAFNGEFLRLFSISWRGGNADDADVPEFYASPMVGLGERDNALNSFPTAASVLVRISCIPDVLPPVAKRGVALDAHQDHENAAVDAGNMSIALGDFVQSVLQEGDIHPWLESISLNIDGMNFTQYDTLGIGLTSKVSVYSNGEKHLVLKQAHTSFGGDTEAAENVFQSEVDILKQLHGEITLARHTIKRDDVIPTASKLACATGIPTVSVKPRCIPLRSFSADARWHHHVRDLVAALYIAACCDVVHRDVRQANMMLGPCDTITAELKDEKRSRAYLIDWGFAVQAETPVQYAGTGRFASQRVLKLLQSGLDEFAVFPNDDTASLVKSLYFIVCMAGNYACLPAEPSSNGSLGKDYCTLVLVFWENVFAYHQNWRAAYDAAEQCQKGNSEAYCVLYNTLCNAINYSNTLRFKHRLSPT